MTTNFRTLLVALALGASSLSVHAQLLNGTLGGVFYNPSVLDPTATLSSSAQIAYAGAKVTFTGASLINYTGDVMDLNVLLWNKAPGLGDPDYQGSFDIYYSPTSAGNLLLSNPKNIKLVTLTYRLDFPANRFIFGVQSAETGSFVDNGVVWNYELGLSGANIAIGENKAVSLPFSFTATAQVSPVPESSTYALSGAALMGALALYRRARTTHLSGE